MSGYMEFWFWLAMVTIVIFMVLPSLARRR